jgi:hypothetical protein
MEMEKVSFMPNRPELVALKYREGKTVEGRFGDQQFEPAPGPPNRRSSAICASPSTRPKATALRRRLPHLPP